MKYIALLIILLKSISTFSQNLIPNGDFEEGPDSSSTGWEYHFDNNCTITTPLLGPNEWVVLSGTPDRLINGDIPCNWDNTLAQSGNSFICIGYMESGKVTLTDVLLKDSLYHFSAFFRLNTFNGLSAQSNRFYVKFSNTSDSIISPILNQTSWTYFDTIFKLTGDNHELELWSTDFVQSGVFIDNLELTKVNTNSQSEYSINKIKIYPNPAQNYLYWNKSDIELSELKISDIQGNEVLFLEGFNDNIIDISNLQNGIYILFLKPIRGNNYYSKIIINK